VITKLEEIGQRVLAEPSLRERYAEIGVVTSTRGEKEFTAFIDTEIARWTPVIKAAKIRAE